MSAIIPRSGPTRQLDRKAEPDEQITPEQAKDPDRVSRLFMSILRDLATLKRRWAPRRIDFEDRTVDATGMTLHQFTHNFAGRVRWWVVDWQTSTGASSLRRHSASDENTLVLVSSVAGTATIRVEEAG
jgi:hypothetical protein